MQSVLWTRWISAAQQETLTMDAHSPGFNSDKSQIPACNLKLSFAAFHDTLKLSSAPRKRDQISTAYPCCLLVHCCRCKCTSAASETSLWLVDDYLLPRSLPCRLPEIAVRPLLCPLARTLQCRPSVIVHRCGYTAASPAHGSSLNRAQPCLKCPPASTGALLPQHMLSGLEIDNHLLELPWPSADASLLPLPADVTPPLPATAEGNADARSAASSRIHLVMLAATSTLSPQHELSVLVLITTNPDCALVCSLASDTRCAHVCRLTRFPLVFSLRRRNR